MANKVPWYLTYDWKSLIGLLVVVIIVVAMCAYYIFPDIKRFYYNNSYKGEASGYIISIKENTKMHQGRYGTRISIDSYTVQYSFNVQSQSITGIEDVDAVVNNVHYLEKIIKSQYKEPITVRYDENNPRNSMIVLP